MPPLSAINAASFSPGRNNHSPGSSSPRAASRRTIPAASAAPNDTPEEAPVQAAAKPKAAPASGAPGAPKKLRRSRVPGNLAQMYGENAAKRDLETAPAAAEEKKVRRDAKAREKRRALMQVDDTLLQRLSQSGPAALIVGEEEEARTRRGRTWTESCGKCGTRSTFRTPGALCPVCGAICLRDAAQ